MVLSMGFKLYRMVLGKPQVSWMELRKSASWSDGV